MSRHIYPSWLFIIVKLVIIKLVVIKFVIIVERIIIIAGYLIKYLIHIRTQQHFMSSPWQLQSRHSSLRTLVTIHYFTMLYRSLLVTLQCSTPEKLSIESFLVGIKVLVLSVCHIVIY